ncbi:LCP family protein [uncultured Schumannella sp.]|uniref:LCP family protein n=1 Tax=uncultured Schumannella sp. TaxID=1195956 RepID=UPI0025D7F553|nr:LCP family protein [uncultured Schumannella sp.]
MSDKKLERVKASARVRPTVARHGRQKRARAWKALLGLVGGGLAVLLVSGSAVAGISVWQTASDIDTEAIGFDAVALPPSVGPYEGGFNILIVGSDSREGENAAIGGYESSTLNDVTMLLHVAADHQSATLVSIPRDLMVPLPACENGGPATATSMNTTLFYGGLSCTVDTVENLTGLEIQFAGLITFVGVIAMSNAVGGVDVCIDGAFKDSYVGLDFPEAGTYTLRGKEALQFLRSRHGVGDGSDLGRISSQQVFLSSLVRKLKSEDTLGDASTVYSLAKAATQNMTLSQNFGRVDILASIALVLKDIPLENIVMVQYPSTTGVTTPSYYAGKVAPLQAQADALFAAIKSDAPIALDDDSLDSNHNGSTLDPNAPTATATPTAEPTESATATPTTEPVTVSGVKGQSADQYTCAVAN